MYHMLIATDDSGVSSFFHSELNWRNINFRPPVVVATADEAVHAIETQRVDCIAYMLKKKEGFALNRYLNTFRPSLPIFHIKRSPEEQLQILREVSRVLDKMHTDISDDVYDEAAVLELLRDELMHALLAGDISSRDLLLGRLQLLRSYLNPDQPCILYEFDLPQGEVYLSSQWHYGSERLEIALRSNFFGRYFNNIYYSVAVLTPRHIRVLACQRKDVEPISGEDLKELTDEHVNQTLNSVKQYLNLDMQIHSSSILPDMFSLLSAT